MAKSNRACEECLSNNAEFPHSGEIRVDRADASRCGFDIIEHRRGASAAHRHTTGEFIQGISHAEGSVAELDTQLVLSIDLMFLRKEEAQIAFELIEELRRMLNVLRRKLSERG